MTVKKLRYLAFALTAVAFCACQKEPSTSSLHKDYLVYTAHDTDADFAAWSGFAWGEHAEALGFLRQQVGIADEAVEQKLEHLLNDAELTEQQKAYLQQMVAYAQANGDITSKTLRNESPFNNIGVVELFGDKIVIAKETLNALHKPIIE